MSGISHHIKFVIEPKKLWFSQEKAKIIALTEFPLSGLDDSGVP